MFRSFGSRFSVWGSFGRVDPTPPPSAARPPRPPRPPGEDRARRRLSSEAALEAVDEALQRLLLFRPKEKWLPGGWVGGWGVGGGRDMAVGQNPANSE